MLSISMRIVGRTPCNVASIAQLRRCVQIHEKRSKTDASFSDRFRQGVESLKGQVNQASKEATSPDALGKASSVVRQKSQKLFEATKPIASSALNKAKEAGMDVTSAAAAKTGQLAKDGLSKAVDATKRGAMGATSAAKESTKVAVQSASTKVQAAVTKPFERIRNNFNGKKITRWIWWWSLAAIGVYGVSTTVPKELIRQAFDRKDDDSKN